MDGRTFPVEVLLLRIGSDQPVEISRLELVSILHERLQIADPEIAGTGLEEVPECQSAHGGIPSRASAFYCDTIPIHLSILDKMTCTVDTVININHAPLSVQTFPVGSPVACAASIVDVEHCYPPARPVLNGISESRRCLTRRASMADSDERRLLTGGSRIVRVLRRIVERVGCEPVCCLKLHMSWD